MKEQIKSSLRLTALATLTSAWWLADLALGIHATRRGYLKAYHAHWTAKTGGLDAVDLVGENYAEDVYSYDERGFQWSKRPVSLVTADRLLELHDAQIEQEAVR